MMDRKINVSRIWENVRECLRVLGKVSQWNEWVLEKFGRGIMRRWRTSGNDAGEEIEGSGRERARERELKDY